MVLILSSSTYASVIVAPARVEVDSQPNTKPNKSKSEKSENQVGGRVSRGRLLEGSLNYSSFNGFHQVMCDKITVIVCSKLETLIISFITDKKYT